MPAISAAANPTAAVAPSAPSGAGKSPTGSEAAERPFSAVFAEQSAKAAKSESGSTGQDTSVHKTSDETSGSGAANESVAAVLPGVVTAPTTIPADFLRADIGDMDAKALDAQIRAAVELMQAVLPPAGNPVTATDTAAIPIATPALLIATVAAPPAPLAEAETGGDLLTRSVADTRLARARDTTDQTSPNAGAAPAKLAAAIDTAVKADDAPVPTFTEFTTAPKAEVGPTASAAAALVASVHVPTASQAAAAGDYRIVPPVGSPHWESAIGNSLVVMTGAGRDRAELVLTPPQLGRIEVSISMKGDEASAVFVSANPVVREALESALPRLREIFAESGITLGQTQVGAESQGESAAQRQTGDNASRSARGNEANPPGETSGHTTTPRVVSRALVDVYA
jgi:flagellar hook-length control protein FliK